MSQRLDSRITKSVLDILKKRDPEWVHLEEIYRHLEINIDFTEKQSELHIQKAGQIEPNWQHDARNLMHGMKRKGIAINPHKNIWGIPSTNNIPDLNWGKIISRVEQLDSKFSVVEGDTILSLDTNEKVTKDLVFERVQHLINCGGIVQLGSFHVWSAKEDLIIDIVEDLEVISTSNSNVMMIIWKPLFVNQDVEKLVSEFQDKIESASEALTASIATSPLVKRTVPREDTQYGGKGIPFAIKNDGGRIYAKDPGVEPSLKPGYRCPGCNGLVFRKWPGKYSNQKKHFSHKETRLQPQNKKCPYFSGTDAKNLWKDMRKPMKQRYLESKEFVVSVTSSWGIHSIELEIPVPKNTEKISVKEYEGISTESIDAINNWQQNYGKITAKTTSKATEFKITAEITVDGNVETRKWKSAGIRGGDIFVADTPDDTTIRRVRPSPDCPRKSTFSDLTVGSYLVYCSSNETLTNQAEGKPKILDDLFLHYFLVNQKMEWPKEWKISEASPEGMLEVSVAFPIHHKPTNPKIINLKPDQDLVIAVKTADPEDAVEIQWWDSENNSKLYLEGEVNVEGWSRHKISSIPNNHNRVQFHLQDTQIARPVNPIEVVSGIGGEEDIDPSELFATEYPHLDIVSIEDSSRKTTSPFDSGDNWSLDVDSDFQIESSWAVPKDGKCRIEYLLEGRQVMVRRDVSNINELNQVLTNIYAMEQNWIEINFDWSTHSQKMNGIPALIVKSNELSNKEVFETDIDVLVPVVEDKVSKSESKRGESLSSKTKERFDDSELIKKSKKMNILIASGKSDKRQKFMQDYVENSIKHPNELKNFISKFLDCEPNHVTYAVRSELEKAFQRDENSKSEVRVRCCESGCTRRHPHPFRVFLARGQSISKCRNNLHSKKVKKNYSRKKTNFEPSEKGKRRPTNNSWKRKYRRSDKF